MTKYKAMILDLVTHSRTHPTAEDIYRVMKQKEPRMVLATVYNNLNALCSEGKINRIVMKGSSDRFDTTVRHDHLVCSKCGKISDKTFSDLTQALEKELGGCIEGYDLRVFYTCDECRNNKNELEKEN